MSSRIPPVLRPEHPTPRAVALLAHEFGLAVEGSLDGLEITGVTLSTSEVRPGDLYVGVRGARSHGAAFASAAREAGAVAILTDGSPRRRSSQKRWTRRSSRPAPDSPVPLSCLATYSRP